MSKNEEVTVTELSKHDNSNDLWVAINGKVFDFTQFAPEHPGTCVEIRKHAQKKKKSNVVASSSS